MGSNSASAGGSDDGFSNTKKSKVSTLTKVKIGLKKTKPIIATVMGGLTKGEEVNRKFFEEKVKPAGKSKYDTYEDYIRARGRGEVDAYGRTVTQRDNGGGNQVVQAPTDATMTAPTTAEVSQSSATDATDAATVDTDDPTYIKRKTKRQGRSLTILTSSKGTSDGLTLGKRSLLGS